MRTFSLLAAFALTGAVSTAQLTGARIVDSMSGIVGLARGQTAVLNVVDDGAEGSTPIFALLAIVGGDGGVLAHKTVALERRKVATLELPFDQAGSSSDRVPVRAFVRLFGRRTDPPQPKPFQVTLEIVDDDGRTTALISCPSDFAFSGNPIGRGDAFFCPTDCNVTLVAPGT